jgi:hypothetical protein
MRVRERLQRIIVAFEGFRDVFRRSINEVSTQLFINERMDVKSTPVATLPRTIWRITSE